MAAPQRRHCRASPCAHRMSRGYLHCACSLSRVCQLETHQAGEVSVAGLHPCMRWLGGLGRLHHETMAARVRSAMVLK
jgi:hypothetical protein